MTQYTLKDFETVAKPDFWRCPSCGNEQYESYESCARHHHYCSDKDNHFLHDYFGERLAIAYLNGVNTRELERRLDIDHNTIADGLESLGVEIRDTSEAGRVWFENLSEDEKDRIAYENQSKAIDTLEKWREENPQQHKENAKQNLPEVKGGMDNWCWKGGCGLRDALTKLYGSKSWYKQRQEAKESDNHTCALCREQKRGGQIHTHHIIPVLAGGSNHKDNLMTLCSTCHQTVESYTWSLPEVTAVFEGQ